MDNLSLAVLGSTNLVPEEEMGVDKKINASVEIVNMVENVLPVEDRAEMGGISSNELDKAAELGAFSPISGMGKINGFRDNTLYAAIYEDEKRHCFIEVREKLKDGTYSPKLRFSQSDLRKAYMCNFNPYTIKKDSPLMLIKSDVINFLKGLIDEQLAMYNVAPEADDILKILEVICEVWDKLPLYKENLSEKRYSFYNRVIEEAKKIDLGNTGHKAYYAFGYEEIEYLAGQLEMKVTDFLKTLKEYGFLYLTQSSNGYQTCVRFKDDSDPEYGTLIPSHTEWRYCVYKLEYFNSYKTDSN